MQRYIIYVLPLSFLGSIFPPFSLWLTTKKKREGGHNAPHSKASSLLLTTDVIGNGGVLAVLALHTS